MSDKKECYYCGGRRYYYVDEGNGYVKKPCTWCIECSKPAGLQKEKD